jgi:hypothetical protein
MTANFMTAKEQLLQELPQLTEDLASQVLAFLRSAKSASSTIADPPAVQDQSPLEQSLLEQSEAALLRQVNLGFSADWWTTYQGLIVERQAETISDADLKRLVAMSEAVEKANVPRIEALGKLAALRGCSIEQVMAALGIRFEING